MVPIELFPKPGARLDLTQLHKLIHKLVLAKREDIGFWSGVFETAWAGYIFSKHSEPNRDNHTLNFIKGQLLSEKRPDSPNNATELAACYMIAAFFHNVSRSKTSPKVPFCHKNIVSLM